MQESLPHPEPQSGLRDLRNSPEYSNVLQGLQQKDRLDTMRKLSDKFAAQKPKPTELNPEVEQAIIQKWKELPLERKKVFKYALKHPCSYCEGEFKKQLGGHNTGKSHGICKRHATEMYAQMGKAPPSIPETVFDMSKLSDDEKKFLGYLNTVIRKRQTKKGVWESVWEEGRCEDYPCCGHGDGGCPDRDEHGNEVFGCSHCGTPLPPHSRSSMCQKCLNRMYQAMEDPTGQDLDDF